MSILEVAFRNVGKTEQAAAIVCDDSLIIEFISRSVFFFFLISEVGTMNESLARLLILSLSEMFSEMLGIHNQKLSFLWKIMI